MRVARMSQTMSRLGLSRSALGDEAEEDRLERPPDEVDDLAEDADGEPQRGHQDHAREECVAQRDVARVGRCGSRAWRLR